MRWPGASVVRCLGSPVPRQSGASALRARARGAPVRAAARRPELAQASGALALAALHSPPGPPRSGARGPASRAPAPRSGTRRLASRHPRVPVPAASVPLPAAQRSGASALRARRPAPGTPVSRCPNTRRPALAAWRPVLGCSRLGIQGSGAAPRRLAPSAPAPALWCPPPRCPNTRRPAPAPGTPVPRHSVPAARRLGASTPQHQPLGTQRPVPAVCRPALWCPPPSAPPRHPVPRCLCTQRPPPAARTQRSGARRPAPRGASAPQHPSPCIRHPTPSASVPAVRYLPPRHSGAPVIAAPVPNTRRPAPGAPPPNTCRPCAPALPHRHPPPLALPPHPRPPPPVPPPTSRPAPAPAPSAPCPLRGGGELGVGVIPQQYTELSPGSDESPARFWSDGKHGKTTTPHPIG